MNLQYRNPTFAKYIVKDEKLLFIRRSLGEDCIELKYFMKVLCPKLVKFHP